MLRIAIVGAGPSGASAGVHLARMGHDVLLFDRAAFPRDKPCGDWLTPLALDEIRAIGLGVAALRARAASSALISSTSLRAPSGRTSRVAMALDPLSPSRWNALGAVSALSADTHEAHPTAPMLEGHHGGGLCIPRARLDAVLVEQAVASGCELRRQAFTTVTPGAPGLEGFDLVVDARGSAAGPVNAVGLRGYWTLPRSALGEDSPLDADFARQAHEVSIRTTARHRRGYGWVFPTDVRDDRVTFNLGVGLWKADIKPGDGPREMLARFLAADPLAGMLERLAVERSHPQGFPLAMGGWSTPRVGSGRWARIGDAAALADPLTGDGIGNALLSGRLLAQAVAEARPEPRSGTTGAPATGGRAPCPDPGDAWQTLFEAKLRPELRRAWLLRQALVPVAAKNGAAWLLDRAPQTVRQKLHQALFGALTYREALF